MIRLRSLFNWLLGKPPAKPDPVAAALDAFRTPDADTLQLLQHLVSVLRGQKRGDQGVGERHARLVARLEGDPVLLAGFRHHVMHFIATRHQLTFFTDSGILPGTGFFSEWWRILWNRILPESLNERHLKDCLHLVYDRTDDWRWLEDVPTELSQRFWTLMTPADELGKIDWRHIEEQLLDAILLLAHRISGLGVDGELMRVSSDFDSDRPRFISLSAEALLFANSVRASLEHPDHPADDGGQLLVIADQCGDSLQRIRKRAQSLGTSLHLSYLLRRGDQSLERLAALVRLLNAVHAGQATPEAIDSWTRFAHAAVHAENRRNSLADYLSQLSRLLAVRVTENAARSGEHYICETQADYRLMWRSAAGAGILIGIMALLKIKAAALHAPLFVEAFLFSMIYGLGFVLIYLLGMTVATKQPAMTAQTLAGMLGDIKPRRTADLDRVADVAAAVCRSQLAAIGGNVMIALPVAIATGIGLTYWLGEPVISPGKSAHLLDDLDILSWTLPHAAIAGFYLFLSGLLTGYFDNQAVYAGVGRRIGHLHWLKRILGPARADRVGQYIENHLGGIMGNFLFGCMLGSTGVIGTILGLPLDIRHIAFSSANLGYALTGFGFELPWKILAWSVLGVAAIGFTNLAVSFTLALRTALDARQIRFLHWGPLFKAIWRHFRQSPRSFLLPPADHGTPAPPAH